MRLSNVCIVRGLILLHISATFVLIFYPLMIGIYIIKFQDVMFLFHLLRHNLSHYPSHMAQMDGSTTLLSLLPEGFVGLQHYFCKFNYL